MTKQEKTFFEKFYPLARELQIKYKIPALVALAQAALESGFGQSTPGNMFFGIKAKGGWTGQTQLLTTTEYHTHKNVNYPVIISISDAGNGLYKYKVKDYFRKYLTYYDSFDDYGRFLTENPRYSKAFKYKNPLLFAKEVFKAGYATSPRYYDSLKSLIIKFSGMKEAKLISVILAVLILTTAVLTVYKTVKFDV